MGSKHVELAAVHPLENYLTMVVMHYQLSLYLWQLHVHSTLENILITSSFSFSTTPLCSI